MKLTVTDAQAEALRAGERTLEVVNQRGDRIAVAAQIVGADEIEAAKLSRQRGGRHSLASVWQQLQARRRGEQ